MKRDGANKSCWQQEKGYEPAISNTRFWSFDVVIVGAGIYKTAIFKG